MPQFFFSIILGLAFISSTSINALDVLIDGKLDDSDWSNAKEITKYYETMPFTLDNPSSNQKVLVMEDEKGMYFGFVNYQKNESIRKQKHQRDDEMANADMVGVTIDFDGDGLPNSTDPDDQPADLLMTTFLEMKMKLTTIGILTGNMVLISREMPGLLKCLFLGVLLP